MENRNPDYQFISTDPEELERQLVAKFEEITGRTVHPADLEKLYIQWVLLIILQERVLTNYTGNQNIPSRAEGKNLEALAELAFMQERPQSKAATCTMRFHISEPQAFAVLVPSGTRVTDKSQTLVWATLEDIYVNAGETYADTKVQCQTNGTAGNGFVVGQINSIVDPFAYFLYCENVTESDGGTDTATDEEFYRLMRLSMDGYSCAGARGAYIYWAMQESTEIADVAAASPTPGVVKIYVLMNDGTLATEEIKSKVYAACSADERRPLTDQVFVEDAEVVPYDIRFTYYVNQRSNQSGAKIDEAVQGAVEQYIAWQCGKLGRDINPSKLISLLMQTGVKRVDLTAPAFVHLHDGSQALRADMSYDPAEAVPQVARVNRIEILNGGYEDE